MAVAGDRSLGQGKSHMETGLASPPSPALARGGHPDPQRSRYRAHIYFNPEPRPSPELLRSHFAR